MQVQEVEIQESTLNSEAADEGGAAAPPAVQPAPAPAPEKSMLDKIKDKGSQSVAPPAAKEAVAAAVAEYKANLKFKAAGKEMDVPEIFRGAMKDAESEKYIHSVLSKAHGIEMIQEKLKSTREDREQIRGAYQQVMEPINYAREAYGREDMDTVFKALAIDPNKVLQWAYKKVELSQMPPDQRQVHEARTQAERRNWELERQTQQSMQQGLSTQGEQLNQMLDLVLERPDVSAIAQAYDTRKGKEGSFRDLVAMMGEQEFNRSGKVISAMEAAKAAVDLLGEKFGAPAPQAPAAPANVQAAQPAAPEVKPKITLPNAGGAKAATPAKSKIRSIDELRKVHQKMASSN